MLKRTTRDPRNPVPGTEMPSLVIGRYMRQERRAMEYKVRAVERFYEKPPKPKSGRLSIRKARRPGGGSPRSTPSSSQSGTPVSSWSRHGTPAASWGRVEREAVGHHERERTVHRPAPNPCRADRAHVRETQLHDAMVAAVGDVQVARIAGEAAGKAE